jgi:hypothetical protein
VGATNGKKTGSGNKESAKAGRDYLDQGGVDRDAGKGNVRAVRQARRGNSVPNGSGKAPQPLENAIRMDERNGAGAIESKGGAGFGGLDKDATERRIAQLRRVLGKDGTVRFEAGLEIIAGHLGRLEDIAVTSHERYKNGHPFIIKSTGVVVDGVIEYETQDAQVSIAATLAEGKYLPLFVPDKVALTNPDGDESYDNASVEELKREAAKLLSKGNAE